ncbi:MAG TPA: hypothetical protein VK211_09995, partial [Kamptonema sp.]|nr:hypothetical protein [Kamptonema sp.]
IEAKSRKKDKNCLNKIDYGQLLTSVEWFKSQYPNCLYIPISILPNPTNTEAIVITETKALTFDKLNQVITDSRQFFEELCTYTNSQEELIVRCEKLLQNSNLQPQKFIETYFIDFKKC